MSRLFVDLVLRNRLDLLAARQARHRLITDPEQMARWQLAAFNQVWQDATWRFRFYADWQRRHRLPDRLSELDEIKRFPILRKAEIETSFTMIAEDAAPCQFTATGGSSGPSVPFPRDRRDHALIHSSMYLGRSWAGIQPGDPIVLIWGHDHLYGVGLRGQLAKWRRRIKDWLIGTRRLSVYQLDDKSVARYVDAIRSHRGIVVVGYVSAIRKLLDFIERSGCDHRDARVRAVIFCSETVFPRDLERVRTILGCMPLIEYGMGETGVMAYSRPGESDVTFFWDSVHCDVAEESELIVTTLQPLRFPLIHYGTGDRVYPIPGAPKLPFRCARITGRTRDVLAIALRDGRTVEMHSEFIEDSLDLIREIRSYFVHQKGNRIDIAVLLDPGHALERIRERFIDLIARQLPEIDDSKLTFSALEREPITIAGKRQYTLRE